MTPAQGDGRRRLATLANVDDGHFTRSKMHVLTLSGKNPAAADFNWGRRGELAFAGFVCCNSDSCGCSRSFSGIDSARAGTVLEVVDDADLTRERVFALCRAGHDRQGWAGLKDSAIWLLVDQNVHTAAQHVPGTLLRPRHVSGNTWAFTLA